MPACSLESRGERPISHPPVEVVVAGLHLRWRGVWQRPNHVLARIGRDVDVIVLEEPLVDGTGADVVDRSGGLTVITPHRVSVPLDAVDERAIDAVRALVGARNPLVWLYTPMMLALADAFPAAPLVFDKMDELAKFAHADPRIGSREQLLLERADLVFAGGRSLFRSVEGRTRTARCYPSGVDVEHFERARSAAPHPALKPYLGGPVFGYVGVVDERIDYALVNALAAACPDATVVMIGPVVKVDPATLPRRANIVYLGKREYDDLPALLAGFDVALMPFAMNEHTENISPTKTLEYLAAGLPVVSTAVPDVVADHAGVVGIARDANEFVRMTRAALHADPERVSRASAKTRTATWDAIVASMRGDLVAAGIGYACPARSSSAALP